MNIEIGSDGAKQVNEALCEERSCGGLSGSDITLRSSKGVEIKWPSEALSNLLCKKCLAKAESAQQRQ